MAMITSFRTYGGDRRPMTSLAVTEILNVRDVDVKNGVLSIPVASAPKYT